MVSGEPCWLYGKDDACHLDVPSRSKSKKVAGDIVIPGQTSYPEADISFLIERFAGADKLQHLPRFVSGVAREVFDLPPPARPTVFVREDWVVPETIERESPTLGTLRATVATGGETRRFRLLRS